MVVGTSDNWWEISNLSASPSPVQDFFPCDRGLGPRATVGGGGGGGSAWGGMGRGVGERRGSGRPRRDGDDSLGKGSVHRHKKDDSVPGLQIKAIQWRGSRQKRLSARATDKSDSVPDL